MTVAVYDPSLGQQGCPDGQKKKVGVAEQQVEAGLVVSAKQAVKKKHWVCVREGRGVSLLRAGLVLPLLCPAF